MAPPSARLARLRDLPFSYRELGATAGPLPPGYDHVKRTWPVGVGKPAFDVASEMVLTFQMHSRAGAAIETSQPRAAAGVDVLQRHGVGPLRLSVPCRVVDVIDDDRARGFAYGTLQGHPLIGEERFVVSWTTDDAVTLTITLFARPANRLVRLAGPSTTLVRKLILDRYAAAISAR